MMTKDILQETFNNIEIYDDLVSVGDQRKFLSECNRLGYNVNAWDESPADASGASASVSIHSYMHNKLMMIIGNNIMSVEGLQPYDCYVNCFFPNENPNWHIDNDSDKSRTLIYYANTNDFNEGGTEFLGENTVMSVLPKAGRIVVFPGNYKHRATSFRDKKRFTIAFKYKP